MAESLPMALYYRPGENQSPGYITSASTYNTPYGTTKIDSVEQLMGYAKEILNFWKSNYYSMLEREKSGWSFGDETKARALQYYNDHGGDALMEKLNSGTATIDDIAKIDNNFSVTQEGGGGVKYTNLQVAKALEQGAIIPSGYVRDARTGAMTTQKAIDEENYWKQRVKDGTAREVRIGNGIGYIPIGSAADLQLQGKTYEQQLATPSVQQQIKEQGLTPVNPTSVTASIPTSQAPTAPTTQTGSTTITPEQAKVQLASIQQLLASGKVTTEQVAPTVKYLANIIQNNNSGGSGGGSESGTGGSVSNLGTGSVVVNDWSSIKNSSYYQGLSGENKALVDYYLSVLDSGDASTMRSFQDALSLAMDNANPYWKEKLSITSDSLSLALGSITGDLAATEKELMEKKERIEEDLIYNKEQLTIEEQAELKRQAESYGIDLETVRGQMASKGLSSSSIRNKAEERIGSVYTDTVESTKREYSQSIREQDVSAARLLEDIEFSRTESARKADLSKKEATRKVEEYLGTENTSKIPGASNYTMGNVYGSMAEDKAKDIIQRTFGFMINSNSLK